MRRYTAVLFLLAAACSGTSEPVPQNSAGAEAVTFAIVNARIWTGDPASPWAEAIAVRGERIAAVGSVGRHPPVVGGRRADGRGRPAVVPGFIDSHVHFLDGGFRLASVQLRDARTREEFVSRIAAFAATVPEGTWITGGDWDHSLWGGELPARAWIDAVTPDIRCGSTGSTATWRWPTAPR